MIGTYTVIEVEKLFLDYTYQRNIRPAFIKKLLAGWDEALASTLDVCIRPQGMFAVVDGGHRLLAYKAKGFSEVPCLVHSARTVAQEAHLFKTLNCSVNAVTAIEQFWASVAELDPDTLEILEIVARNGLTVSRGPSNHVTQSRSIAAVNKLVLIKHKFGAEILSTTLNLIARAWPMDGRAFKGIFMEGVAIFLYLYSQDPLFSLDRAIHKMDMLNPEKVLAEARNTARTYSRGPQYSIPPLLVLAFNKGLNETKKLQQRDVN